ncbi:MAG: glycosyl hydrolase [Saprospiraceae bacterium]|nr:glycosyl hydrolase [Saprospiraceae bacterium]
MSYRIEKYLSLPKVNQEDYLKGKSEQEKHDIFLEILHNKVHGFCFSLYEEGQKPGDKVTPEQVYRRMRILKPHTQWIRSFSSTDGNELIPKIAKELGMNTLVGAWLSDDADCNEREIEGLIDLANKGLVDIAAVGNEVLYRKDLSEHQLLSFIDRVKKAIPHIPVGYVDAYYEFSARPAITEMCDIILANCYPFWESCPFENSLSYLKEMYDQTVKVSNGKKILITETGWPSEGERLGEATPTKMNAFEYFINTQLWAMDKNIECFYFSSFDESWKVNAEGQVGAYWGIWNKDEQLKYSL